MFFPFPPREPVAPQGQQPPVTGIWLPAAPPDRTELGEAAAGCSVLLLGWRLASPSCLSHTQSKG